MRKIDFQDGFESSTPSSSEALPAVDVSVTPTGNLNSDNVQDAFEEHQMDIDSINTDIASLESDVSQLQADVSTALNTIDNHITDNSDAHDASAISFNPTGTIAATDVQGAVFEVATDAATALSSHDADTTAIHGIADTSELLTTSNAKTVTNKDIDGGIASNTSRITIPKASKTTLDGLTRKEATLVYASDTDKLYYDDGSALKLVGSGTGSGVNFITNGDAEDNTTGWNLYNDSSTTRPVDGTGGMASDFSFTRSTTSPLDGQASFLFTGPTSSRQGMGVSYDFTVPTSARAKVLQIEFDYMAVGAGFTAGSTTTDSDVIIYIYDVSSSRLIEPSSFKLLSNSSTIPDKFIANFHTSATGTQYRLILHIATGNDGWVLKFDNIAVRPCNYVYGTPITDWAVYTNPTTQGLGTITSTNLRWRRIGDSMQLQGGFATGTVTADVARLGLPPGVTIGGTTSSRVQTGFVNRNSGSAVQLLAIQGATYLTFGAGASSHGDGIGNNLFGSSEQVYFSTDPFQIQGWSSAVQMSNGYDGRVIASRHTSTNSGAWPTSDTVINYVTSGYDTTASVTTGASWNFKIPSDGYYKITAGHAASMSGAGTLLLKIRKSGTIIKTATYPANAATSNISFEVNTTNHFRAGDTIDIVAGATGAVGTFVNDANSNVVVIDKIQAPTTMSATELVAFSAEGATSNSVGTNTVIPYNTIIQDTHNRWNSTNKDWEVPVAGTYEVIVKHRILTAGTATVNQYAGAKIQIDTVDKDEEYKYVENTGVTSWFVSSTWQGPLNSGQKIRGVADTNITSPQLGTLAVQTKIIIRRLK